VSLLVAGAWRSCGVSHSSLLIGEGSSGLYWSLAALLFFFWAFIGIGIKNAGEHQGFAYTAYILALGILLAVLFYHKARPSAR
jgi:hypothetical protein